MHPRTRALYRLLNIHKHQLLPHEHCFGLHILQPHIEEHLRSTYSATIMGACESARSRTSTDLSYDDVLALYCTVRTILKIKHSYLLNC
jgi:hypothetical protein